MHTHLLSTRRVADLFGISVRSLERWRIEGTGPDYFKIGSRVLYASADIESWLQKRRRQSTSQENKLGNGHA